MKRRNFTNGLLGLAATAPIGSRAATDAKAGKPIRIGVLSDFSGVVADATGKGSLEGARIAAEEMGGRVIGEKDPKSSLPTTSTRADVGATIARKWLPGRYGRQRNLWKTGKS